MTTAYKLTDQNMETYNHTKWIIGEWQETTGEGKLCGSGWLHCYSDPLLAVFFNPIHADFRYPRLFEVEVEGKLIDEGCKQGWTRMRLVREIPLPILTIEQRVEIAIRCAKQVSTNPQWNEWADNWLSGEDRSLAAAAAAASSAAAAAASWASAAAVEAAAWASVASAASWASAAAVEAAWASVASAAAAAVKAWAAVEAWAAYEAVIEAAAAAGAEAVAEVNVKDIIYQVIGRGENVSDSN